MNKILIIGASGHAKVVIDIIEKEGKYEIFGLIDSFKKKGNIILGYEILGTENNIPSILKNDNIYGGIIAIGDNWSRKNLYLQIKNIDKHFNFISTIHPNTSIGKNVTIGSGTVLMPGSIITSNCIVDDFCIINTAATLGHDSVMSAFSSLAPGVHVGGNCNIGECTAISMGTSIIENISIGEHSVIGASSLVINNINSYKTVYGIPAKEIRTRIEGEKYLSRNKIMTKAIKRDLYSFEHYVIKDEDAIKTYNDVLTNFNQDTIFYSYHYTCQNHDNCNLNYFVLKKHNTPIAIMPFFLAKRENNQNNKIQYDSSSPYGYSGPLFSSNIIDEDMSAFWQSTDDWYKDNNIITEFIRFNLDANYKNYSGHLIHTLDNVKGKITDFETIWANFKQKVRNNYRKAEKSGLTIKIYSNNISEDIIESFNSIYNKTMDRNEANDNYYYPTSYFINLVNNNKENILIALIFNGEKPISAELIIRNNNILYSYLGGTLSDYFHLRPNDFLKIEVIKWAIENNIDYYILGGGRVNNDGLYQYKKSFFPKDEDVIYYTGRKIIDNKSYMSLIKEIDIDYEDVKNLIENKKSFFPLYNQKQPTNNTNPYSLTVITSKKEWQETIESIGEYDFYHTYDYHELSKTDDENAVLLKYTEKDSLICLPLIIRKIEGSTHYDATSVYGYSGPLQKNISNSFNNLNFIKVFNQFLEKNNIISVFSRLNPFINGQEIVLKGLGKIQILGNVVNIDVTKNIDDQRAFFSKDTKRYINKGRKLLKVKCSNTKEDVLEFKKLYYENMDRVNAKKQYYFDEDYFLKFINSKDFKTDILFAIHSETEEIISAAMMVKTNNIVQFHISGTKTEFLNLSPIRLLINEMRIKATEEKYKYFNLGGGLGNNEDGLFRFKSSFSKDFKPFKVWKHISNTKAYNELVKEKGLDENIEFFPLYRYATT